MAGKTIVNMLDADQSLTDSDGRNGIVQTTGVLTADRKLTFTAPALAVNSYATPLLNKCTGGSIVVTVGVGNTVSIEPGAKALVQITASGVEILVDLPLDPRDFGCPWDGANDDLPGLNAMLATIPGSRQRPTLVQLPKGQGYCSDNWHITRTIRVVGHGRARMGGDLPQNGLRFAPLKGVIFDGAFTTPSYPVASADLSEFKDVAIISTQAVVTDAGGNIGRANYFLDTSVDTWANLPTPPAKVPLGSVVIRSGASVGSTADYTNDGATRDTTHLVMFRCTTAGTKGSSVPGGFATAGTAQIGTTISAVGGGAVWTVESVPKDYRNVTSYGLGERVIVPGEPDHVFECIGAGTSMGWETTIAAGSDGASLAMATTINVASAAAFPASGKARVISSAGAQIITYTSKSATALMGCSGGTGTLSTGAKVSAPFASVLLDYAAWGIGARIPRGMLAPSYGAVFYDRAAAITAGATLPATTISVDDTTDFAPGPSTVQIWNGSAFTTVSYTGKTGTTLFGCTGGAGTLSVGAAVGQGVKWKHIPSQCVTVLANGVTIDGCALSGATGCAMWVQSNADYAAANGNVTTGGSTFWALRNSLIQWCGSGLQTNSNNVDGGEAQLNQFDFLGAGRTQTDAAAYNNFSAGRFGHGGAIIKDRCQGNNKFSGNHGATTEGMPYRNDLFQAGVGNSGVWNWNPEECTLPSLIVWPALVSGMLGGLTADSSATRIEGGGLCANVVATAKSASDPSLSTTITLGAPTSGTVSMINMRCTGSLGPDTDAVGFGVSDDVNYFPKGWYVFGKQFNAGYFDSQLFMFPRPGVSTWPSGAALTVPAPFWIAQNHLWIGEGDSVYNGDPRSIGFTPNGIGTPPAVGYFVKGSFVFNANAAVDLPIGWQCTASGSPGTWTPVYAAKRGQTTIAMGNADKTPTASQLTHRTLVLTGANTALRRLFLPVPASNDDGAEYVIDASGITGFGIVVDLVGSIGTTVTIALGKTAIIRTNTGGVKRQTSDV